MKVVDLQEYKSKLALKKQIKKLESISKTEYESLSITEQKGYHNFMRLLKALSAAEHDLMGGGLE